MFLSILVQINGLSTHKENSMSNQAGYKNRGNNTRKFLIPIMASGSLVYIDLAGVSKKDWTQHHGQTKDGAQVHSLETLQVADSLIVRRQDGKNFSVEKNDFEVMAKQVLEGIGYVVTAPEAAQ